jgi:DNA-binding NarL/FixJ family response regulator
LTPREREILGYIARGLTKKEMARVMGISVKTVEQHCIHLMDKLEIHDRVNLARFAIREGWVEPS